MPLRKVGLSLADSLAKLSHASPRGDGVTPLCQNRKLKLILFSSLDCNCSLFDRASSSFPTRPTNLLLSPDSIGLSRCLYNPAICNAEDAPEAQADARDLGPATIATDLKSEANASSGPHELKEHHLLQVGTKAEATSMMIGLPKITTILPARPTVPSLRFRQVDHRMLFPDHTGRRM